MARKETSKQDGSPKAPDKEMAEAVRESTHQIWLAGLGAFAKAQLEGTKMFESLVREGSELQRRTLLVAENRLGEVTGRVAKVAGEFSRQATGSWDKLEQVFEDRVARALSRLGVPSGRDIRELTELLNELNSKVAALNDARLEPGLPARKAGRKAASPAAPAKASRSGKTAKAVRADKTGEAVQTASTEPAEGDVSGQARGTRRPARVRREPRDQDSSS